MAKTPKPSGTYETKQQMPDRPFMFPTIGDGITVMAKTQEEANAKAAEIKENLAQYGSPKPPAEKSDDAGDAK